MCVDKVEAAALHVESCTRGCEIDQRRKAER